MIRTRLTKLVSTLALVAMLALSLSVVSVEAGGPSPLYEAKLTAAAGFKGASGKAFYYQGNEGELKVSVEVSKLTSVAGTAVDVWVDGAKFGSLLIDRRGNDKASLETTSGDPVSSVHAGSVIEVRSGATVMLSGTFK